jgi:CRISPR-associated endonuclease/helicase Cas3
VFLLSATLPEARRKRLIRAFSPNASVPDDLKYPCVFGIDLEGGTACKPVEMLCSMLELTPEVVGTSNKIERMAGLITEMIENGGCAACILNTVSEAQELYEKLKDCLSDTDLILFHSRFTLERRLAIEKAITRKYGIKRDKRPPRGVVIATQVIEQSLDLDFDYMVTDLAPIDLLLQRAGRLHRHVVRKFSRVLHVMIPNLLSGSSDFGPSRYVYFPDILHRTGRLFVDTDVYRTVRVEIPTGVNPLVEAVYGETDEMQNHNIQFEEMLSKWLEDRLGKQQAETFLARLLTLPSVHTHCNEPGYLADLPNDRDEDAVLSTRVARPSITLVVLKEGDDISVCDDHAARKFYRKSLNSDNPGIFRHFSKEAVPKEWEQSPLLRNCRPLFLRNRAAEYGGVELYYDKYTGLKIKRTGGTR